MLAHTGGAVEAPIEQSGPRASEMFNGTIEDLENLMSEALNLARQAAERGDTKETTGLPLNATALHNAIKQRAYNRGRLRSVLRSRPSVMLLYEGRVHESASSSPSDSASQHSDLSDHIYEERYPRTTYEFARTADDNAVVAQPVVMPRNQST
jgi:hypothetical protein